MITIITYTNLAIGILILLAAIIAIRASYVRSFLSRFHNIYTPKNPKEYKALQNSNLTYMNYSFHCSNLSFFKLLFCFKKLNVENFYATNEIEKYFKITRKKN
jgi:hypothetical protein